MGSALHVLFRRAEPTLGCRISAHPTTAAATAPPHAAATPGCGPASSTAAGARTWIGDGRCFPATSRSHTRAVPADVQCYRPRAGPRGSVRPGAAAIRSADRQARRHATDAPRPKHRYCDHIAHIEQRRTPVQARQREPGGAHAATDAHRIHKVGGPGCRPHRPSHHCPALNCSLCSGIAPSTGRVSSWRSPNRGCRSDGNAQRRGPRRPAGCARHRNAGPARA